jgi:hypothetical protein
MALELALGLSDKNSKSADPKNLAANLRLSSSRVTGRGNPNRI